MRRNTHLANEAELIERAAWASLFHRAAQLGEPVEVWDDAETLGIRHRTDTGLLLNRVWVGKRLESRTLARFPEPRRLFVHGSVAGADAARFGLEPYPRAWLKLGGAIRVEDTRCDFAIRRAELTPQGAGILCDAFDLSSSSAGVFLALNGVPGWSAFGAFDGDAWVATAMLFTRGPHACLFAAATAPAARGHGAQKALIAARLAHARVSGATQAFSETGERMGEEPNPSLDNLIRAGLEPVMRRPNFVPVGVRW